MSAGPSSSRPVKTGIYGGTFDPIHRGHVEPVLAAAESLGLDRVLYLPTAQPPHKRGRQTAPAWRRFAMVELALLDIDSFEVSTFELDEEVAFTIDTIEHFERRMPADQLFLILGADSFRALETWRRGDEIAARIDLVVLARPGSTLEPHELAEPQRAAIEAGRVHFVRHPPIPASSTEIRRHLASGEAPPDSWLDARVLEYALKYRLYRDGSEHRFENAPEQ